MLLMMMGSRRQKHEATLRVFMVQLHAVNNHLYKHERRQAYCYICIARLICMRQIHVKKTNKQTHEVIC
jgi:hypothetical protein